MKLVKFNLDPSSDPSSYKNNQRSTYIDDGVSSIIEEKFNGKGSIPTLSTGTLAEESTQKIDQDLKVVEEAKVLALPKSKTEDIYSSVIEEPADNKSKLILSGLSENEPTSDSSKWDTSQLTKSRKSQVIPASQLIHTTSVGRRIQNNSKIRLWKRSEEKLH
ncbi:14372_t:CDS:2, partial [Dentiscutata erythropus]